MNKFAFTIVSAGIFTAFVFSRPQELGVQDNKQLPARIESLEKQSAQQDARAPRNLWILDRNSAPSERRSHTCRDLCAKTSSIM